MEQRECWVVAYDRRGYRFDQRLTSLADCRWVIRKMASMGWRPLYRLHIRLKPKQD